MARRKILHRAKQDEPYRDVIVDGEVVVRFKNLFLAKGDKVELAQNGDLYVRGEFRTNIRKEVEKGNANS